MCERLSRSVPVATLCRMVFITRPSLLQISSSNDGRLCLWDLEAGQRLKEISWKSPLTSVCCLVSRLYVDEIHFGPDIPESVAHL